MGDCRPVSRPEGFAGGSDAAEIMLGMRSTLVGTYEFSFMSPAPFVFLPLSISNFVNSVSKEFTDTGGDGGGVGKMCTPKAGVENESMLNLGFCGYLDGRGGSGVGGGRRRGLLEYTLATQPDILRPPFAKDRETE